MAYDWSGVRTRRIRQWKLTAAILIGLLALAALVLALA